MDKLKTIDIKGKKYVTVNERLKYFRDKYPSYGLLSEVVGMDSDAVCIKATIYDENGKPIATGLASEERVSSNINKTSYVENCETSAWGRCLANFGIGIDENVASADELSNALERQEALREKIDKNKQAALQMLCDEKGVGLDMVLARYDLDDVKNMTMETWSAAMKALEKTAAKK